MPFRMSLPQAHELLCHHADLEFVRQGADRPLHVTSELFYDIVAQMGGDDYHNNWSGALADQPPSLNAWRSALEDHCYNKLFSPRLERSRARLNHFSSQVLQLWKALQTFCRWLADELWQSRQEGGSSLMENRWNGPLQISSVAALEMTIPLPENKGAIVLYGESDSLWRIGPDGPWRIIHFGRLEAHELGLRLYLGLTAMLLKSNLDQAPSEHLILTQFSPDLAECTADLREVEEALEIIPTLLALMIEESQG